LEGGGEHQATEQASVVVTAYTRIELDRGDHTAALFHDDLRGLMRLKRKILRCLTNHALLDEDDYAILRNPLYPIHAYRPAKDERNGLARISVEFGVDFDWDLDDEDDEV
jgi:hypothetical protein